MNQPPLYTSEQVANVELELQSPPVLPYLSVFIRSTAHSQFYNFRKFGVSNGTMPTEAGDIPFVDLHKLDLGDFNTIPCPEYSLEVAVRNMVDNEKLVGASTETQEVHAVVGVAEYHGPEKFTADQLVDLVGMKYFQMMEEIKN
ncbi:MAG: hypothetical protein ABIC95_02445 [archaeon]